MLVHGAWSGPWVWDEVRRQQVQWVDCVPSFLESVVADMPGNLPLEHLLVGGEKLASRYVPLPAPPAMSHIV